MKLEHIINSIKCLFRTPRFFKGQWIFIGKEEQITNIFYDFSDNKIFYEINDLEIYEESFIISLQWLYFLGITKTPKEYMKKQLGIECDCQNCLTVNEFLTKRFLDRQ